VDIICQLPPFLSKHMLSVTPVIGQVPATWVPQPNPDEVGAVFSVPLSAFLDRAKHR
jgi:coenzyme A diphosphatase NUDT7